MAWGPFNSRMLQLKIAPTKNDGLQWLMQHIGMDSVLAYGRQNRGKALVTSRRTVRHSTLRRVLHEVNLYIDERLLEMKYEPVSFGPVPYATVVWAGYLILYERLALLYDE